MIDLSVKMSEGNKVSVEITNNHHCPVDISTIQKYFHSYYLHMSERKSHSVSDLVVNKGIGLGLYVSSNIIQCLSGLIEYSHTGSSVTFNISFELSSIVSALPLSEEAVQWVDVSDVSNAHVVPAQVGPPLTVTEFDRPVRILIVDDTSICQKVLTKILRNMVSSFSFFLA